MAEMVLDCPHCTSERTGFEFTGERRYHSASGQSSMWNTFFACRKCQEAVIVKLKHSSSPNARPSQCHGDPRDEGFNLTAIHPKPQKIDVPEDVPKEIAQDFREAVDNLRRQNWTSAGMMFRKVMQRSTTRLAPEGVDFTRKKLEARIDDIADRLLITPAMKQWGHIIRLDGNEATHEEDEVFTREKATQMKDFSEVFLLYGFTLPARVEMHSKPPDPNA